MLISDVTQRRLIIKGIEHVKSITENNEGSRLLEYKEIDDDLFLVTMTDLRFGDYYKSRVYPSKTINSPGLAKEDIETIKEFIKIYEESSDGIKDVKESM